VAAVEDGADLSGNAGDAAGSLRATKTQWEADRHARMEKWRAAREARRASLEAVGLASVDGQP
jgi:hypothetical protein